MHKLNAMELSGLGAPSGGGALQIEAWLRALLGAGVLRLPGGVVELRGHEPVVTTLRALKEACGVAVETIKQGLRALEMDHWVLLVDGAHTRLLGPPRFSLSISKENLWGSVGGSIEVSPAEGLNPLESIDYEHLASRENIHDCKKTLMVMPIHLLWRFQARLSSGKEIVLPEGTEFLLAAGSIARTESGRSGSLTRDLCVAAAGGRSLRALERLDLRLKDGPALPIEAGSLLELERSNVIRLASKETGILSISPVATADGGEPIDWCDDSHWLGRFRPGTPLVLLRRAVYASLLDVVAADEAGPSDVAGRWNVVLGVHDCILDGLIPFRAGVCPEKNSTQQLLTFLRSLGLRDSLRARMKAEFGVGVEAADVRVSATRFALGSDRKLLRHIATDPQLNSELLSVGNQPPCWTQVGAYCRQGEGFPWEVTRELYFTHVSLRFRQTNVTSQVP